jgi:hypothetical protein
MTQAERAFNKHGKWTRLHLERLPLLPMEFMWAEQRPDMQLQGLAPLNFVSL